MLREEIPKTYDAAQNEDRIYDLWEKSGFFNPDNLLGERRESFSIVLPPPNVTGTLHMGHAVMLAIEDIMVRFVRMRGKRALWLPGTDHAAIATQTKVEKNLIAEGIKDPRGELGRERFLEKVRQFAAESHDVIVHQMRKIGASLDWSREAYTLDEPRNLAVRMIFKMMYDDGLIYRGERVINWCTRCKSTLADDEVEYTETTAKFYTFRYDKNFPLVISTTRPETKLGDTAVAVHPDDERYQAFIGQTIRAKFVGRDLELKIIADPAVDPNFGTGALGVTPAHSHVDADLARRHDLPTIQIIGEDGLMTSAAGQFSHLSVIAARIKIAEQLRDQGLMEKEEDVPQNLSICYRCAAPVEPLPKRQWFIDVNKKFALRNSRRASIDGLNDGQEVTLKELMQHVVRSGQIKIIPERFEKTYFHWIDNLRDWCISRQIWFGHQVPVWYRREEGSKESKDEEIFVGTERPASEGWTRDSDTLDTWFSSGIWTFSTLGWPNQTEDLKIFHPTSVLETGYDILPFWVARMILMTTYALGEVPFRAVYLHGLIRDENGRKMSKSLNNVIDPLEMIAKFGADATRLSLVIGATPGNDVKLSESKIEGYRNFTNKLWNIGRFILGKEISPSLREKLKIEETPPAVTLADRWILGRLAEVARRVTDHLERYEFSAAGELLRDFTWSDFADWYLEIAKLQKQKEIEGERKKDMTDRILLFVLKNLLKLWHPFMPFITERIWEVGGWDDQNVLMIEPWPEAVGDELDEQTRKEFSTLRDVIAAVRNLRAEYKVEPAKMIQVMIVDPVFDKFFESQAETIKHLARLESLTVRSEAAAPPRAVAAIVGTTRIFIPLAELIDFEKERTRLNKELEEVRTYAASLTVKLNQDEFVAKAPVHVVEKMRTSLNESQKKIEIIESQLAIL